MTDDIGGDEPLLNRAQLASAFNTSENTIDKWRAKGMPVEVEGGNGVPYQFRYSDCLRWHNETRAKAEAERREAEDFVAQKRMAFLGLEKEDQKAGLSPAEIRELSQAELLWMQAAERRRTLIHVDEVVDLLEIIFTEVRAGLDGQPDWLEREFALSGEDVERVVTYNDDILGAIKAAIVDASLSEGGAPDPLDEDLI